MAAVNVAADMYYEYYGYTYTIFNNTSISLAGWDNRDSKLVIPKSIENRNVISVANYAFNNNTDITSVDFSQAYYLKRIGMDAFRGCSSINEKIILPATLQYINDSAFMECTSLPGVMLTGDLKTIPDQCFYGCTALSEVKLNDGLESILRIAFAYCPSLTYVEIPRTVTSIDQTAFYADTNLTLGVYTNSYAHEYAIAQNIPYVLLDGAFLGDANGDGSVNINDVTTIQRYLAELETLEGIYLHAADANQDGTVDIADATVIQMYLAEYEMEYPIGEVMTQ